MDDFRGRAMRTELTGLVGWRGMVGSVLLERMQAEGDFALIEPLFFSTSDKGGVAPPQAKNETRLQDAYDIDALRRCGIVISTQGGEYTKDVYPRLRGAGWDGVLDRRGQDAAHAGRCGASSSIPSTST